MTAACNFISLKGKKGEVLDKNEGKKRKKRKKKRGKLRITRLDKKGAKFARCVTVFFGKAE